MIFDGQEDPAHFCIRFEDEVVEEEDLHGVKYSNDQVINEKHVDIVVDTGHSVWQCPFQSLRRQSGISYWKVLDTKAISPKS